MVANSLSIQRIEGQVAPKSRFARGGRENLRVSPEVKSRSSGLQSVKYPVSAILVQEEHGNTAFQAGRRVRRLGL